MKYRQHPETGLVQRVHEDGTHHLPSFDQRCADGTCEDDPSAVKNVERRQLVDGGPVVTAPVPGVTVDLEPQLRREQAAIAAMHARISRNPLRSLLWNRPWRATWRPRWSNRQEVRQWLHSAHDCADPSVACSCAGGFRFPNRQDPS